MESSSCILPQILLAKRYTLPSPHCYSYHFLMKKIHLRGANNVVHCFLKDILRELPMLKLHPTISFFLNCLLEEFFRSKLSLSSLEVNHLIDHYLTGRISKASSKGIWVHSALSLKLSWQSFPLFWS